MTISLPLEKMSFAEKLHVMEQLWDDLCQTPEAIPPPEWHEQLLRERTKRLQRGESSLTDWSEAKEKIRGAVK